VAIPLVRRGFQKAWGLRVWVMTHFFDVVATIYCGEWNSSFNKLCPKRVLTQILKSPLAARILYSPYPYIDASHKKHGLMSGLIIPLGSVRSPIQ
jgi:hypothetical protein